MNKGLEALKEARNIRHEKDKNLVVIDIDYFNRCLDCIEASLKDSEKEHKAFEIIIENDIRISDFKIFNTFASFNQRRSLIGLRTISKEKYDLLREVLKDE